MRDNLISALNHLKVAELTRAEWVAVGMSLKEEGYDCSVWDEWSRDDARYHPGECEKQWKSFHGSSTPVKGGTIVQMAKERGWVPYSRQALDWNDVISYDAPDDYEPDAPWDQTAELAAYIRTLFRSDDIVGYVTGDAWQDEDGKWKPGRGVYTRTAGELLTALEKHPGDIGAAVGDWKPDAGAWIRFNPLDGQGVSNTNVTAFRYALVESDTLPVEEQEALYRRLELPIACMVHSGGKSVHAIVRVDAPDYAEYRKRVDFLYDYLGKNGATIDRQNRNPSRLSRMPGITRGGERQRLLATNIGRRSWVDWMDFVEGVEDELPEMEALSVYQDDPPSLPEELISGILRRGHKMLLSGSSKAGKSFLLMELCVSLAEGIPWLGFPVKKGRVLYINLEIDHASAINRFLRIYDALGVKPKHADDIVLWNLRGHAAPLDKLVPKLIRRVGRDHFEAIIFDPIYKIITGDENNASEMGAFCNQFDKICTETGCSVIYCHHHSKGAQGMKRAMDRASGSGVFSRDPDAQLDMIQLVLSEEAQSAADSDASTGWRLESSLREFPNFKPINVWFDYPVHRVDDAGLLGEAHAIGSRKANLQKNPKYTTPEQRLESLRMAYMTCTFNGEPATVAGMAAYLGVTDRCVRDRLTEFRRYFRNYRGTVVPVKQDDSDNDREQS